MINESSLALKEAAKMRAQKIEGERAGRSAAKKGQVEASSSGPARNSAAGPSPTPAFSLEAGRCEVSVRLAAPRPQTATTNGAVAVAPPAEVATPVELEDPPAADPVMEAVSTYECALWRSVAVIVLCYTVTGSAWVTVAAAAAAAVTVACRESIAGGGGADSHPVAAMSVKRRKAQAIDDLADLMDFIHGVARDQSLVRQQVQQLFRQQEKRTNYQVRHWGKKVKRLHHHLRPGSVVDIVEKHRATPSAPSRSLK